VSFQQLGVWVAPQSPLRLGVKLLVRVPYFRQPSTVVEASSQHHERLTPN
jgi:hypothetical protein